MKRQKIPDEIKQAVLDIFGRRCGICGEVDGLHIHHVDKDATHNDIENLFLCCYMCHAYVFHPEKADEIIYWHEEKFG